MAGAFTRGAFVSFIVECGVFQRRIWVNCVSEAAWPHAKGEDRTITSRELRPPAGPAASATHASRG